MGVRTPADREIIRLCPGLEYLSVDWLRRAMGFSPSGMVKFLEALQLQPQDFKEYTGSKETQEYVLSSAFYMAVLAAGLPNDPVFQDIAKDPTATLLCSMVTLLYGSQYQDDLKERLYNLGDAILKTALTSGRSRKQARVGRPVKVESEEGGVTHSRRGYLTPKFTHPKIGGKKE